MTITKRDVEYAANLARLKFQPKELEGFTAQLDRIVEYVAKLNELDTSSVKPMDHVLAFANVMREDVARQKPPDPILYQNAPELKEKLFQVPQILE
jgi:aspartyl-tRNA(Asn)/glutamyl-tRNA(Gln) amidotransferase subunit C